MQPTIRPLLLYTFTGDRIELTFLTLCRLNAYIYVYLLHKYSVHIFFQSHQHPTAVLSCVSSLTVKTPSYHQESAVQSAQVAIALCSSVWLTNCMQVHVCMPLCCPSLHMHGCMLKFTAMYSSYIYTQT